MKVTALIVGSSLLGPLRRAEGEINRRHAACLNVCAYNFGAPLVDEEWASVERDVCGSEVVFVIHVTDGENASRLIELLKRHGETGKTVVVINCMPELMRRTRMGRLSFGRLFRGGRDAGTRGRGDFRRPAFSASPCRPLPSANPKP